MRTDDLLWLLRNTVPVAGERAAALESWSNVLRAAGLYRIQIQCLQEEAEERWRATDLAAAPASAPVAIEPEPTPGDELVGAVLAQLDEPDPPPEGRDLAQALETIAAEVARRLALLRAMGAAPRRPLMVCPACSDSDRERFRCSTCQGAGTVPR